MPIYRLGNDIPADAYFSAEPTVIGRVRAGERASVWFGATLCGDNEPITIGEDSNVQDVAILHTDPRLPLAEGHRATLHSCTIGEGSPIGGQALLMNGATTGRKCLVGAGATVTERKSIPDRSPILGVPATVVRRLTDVEVARQEKSAGNYTARSERYRSHLERIA